LAGMAKRVAALEEASGASVGVVHELRPRSGPSPAGG
jgi:hypothetical protein